MHSQSSVSIDDLRSLQSNLERVWQILITVATGGEHITDVQDSYADLRVHVDRCVEKLRAAGANFKVEIFSSLPEWQNYWRKCLKSYASRRAFVADRLSGPVTTLAKVIAEVDSAVPTATNVIALLNQYCAEKRVQLDFRDLHPSILMRCKVHFDNGQYDDAVLVAMKLVETGLREASGLQADDVGVSLASKALSKDGLLFLPDAKTTSEQEAVHQLFRGALGFFKNPLSHRFLDETDPHYTFMVLGFASVLLTLIERLQPQPKP
jgi:uncharacterized protein (TIGR02391 family)